jgi:hypothetical protein
MDVVKEIKEIKTQLAYSKNIGFFFGAGTSCALNIPDIRLPLLHDFWLDCSFARLCGSREELKTLAVIREPFAPATPDVQRQVAMAVFTGMTLTNQKVTFPLKSPFLFREHQLPSYFEQNPFHLPCSWHLWQCGRD